MICTRPFWPYLLVFVLPIITAFASLGIVSQLPDCGGDEPWWEAGHIRLAFLPGLLNLLPLAWLLSRTPKVREAAVISGLMGTAQFALPQGAFAAYAIGPGAGGQIGNASCTISSFSLLWVMPGMFILWLVCVIMGAAILYGKLR